MANVQRPLHVVPIWRLVLGGLIVVGICSLLCWRWGWCWWCPDVDCCEPEPAAQIIVEDMHAAIWMPIENSSFHFDDPNDPDVDEFLYLRRVRSDSLVHSQATGMKSTVRQELHDAWPRDFAEIQGGRLALEDSSLAPHHLDPLPELIPLDGASTRRSD